MEQKFSNNSIDLQMLREFCEGEGELGICHGPVPWQPGIDALPETILFAPDGTIIARGLHGEDIERQLIVLKKSY